jgi:hypothetical protein
MSQNPLLESKIINAKNVPTFLFDNSSFTQLPNIISWSPKFQKINLEIKPTFSIQHHDSTFLKLS